jgi:HlyD family secretion protein
MFKFWKKNKDDQTDTGFRDDFTETDEFALPSWSRSSLYALTSFFIIILCWACISKIDKIVKAQGKLITTGREIVVRPLVDSIVKSIDVRVGQVVKKGQKILTLDPTFAKSDLAQVNIRIENAKAAIYRAQCELNHKDYVIPKEDNYGTGMLQYNIFKQRTSAFNAKMQSFDSQILSAREASRSASVQLAEVKNQIEYADQIRKMRQEVYAAGYDTRLNLLQAENEYSRYKTQAESFQNTIAESNFEIRKLESEKDVFINEWRKDLSIEIAKNSSEADTNLQQFAKAELYSQLVEMTVPQDSVVLEIGHISIGSVAKTGEALVSLVPLNEPIEAEARISPQDVGFIRQGDACKIKIDAFPFQKHGGLKGVLKSIGEDTIKDPARQNEGPYYLGRITLNSTKLKKVPEDTRLIPGMSLSAEIVVGERTVISYILYPMISMFDESIREP